MTMVDSLTVFTTLFVIIDPIGLTPIFVALTPDRTFRERRNIAFQASLSALCILVLFSHFGENVLLALGIEMVAFQISGGILLFIIALEMLFQKRAERRKKNAIDELPNPAIFPLSTPLIAGPGALAAVVLISNNSSKDVVDIIWINLIIIIIIFIVFVSFLLGNALEKLIGGTGIELISRILGMLLASLSVQIIINGF